MNRIDRLFALMLELHVGGRDGGWIQADELAQTFGVSVRTVYRDVAALSESGVPVVSLAGKGYRLLDGYFLPPLQFTPTEALLLILGAGAVREAFDTEYAQFATSALQKLEAALPDERRAELQRIQGAVRIVPQEQRNEAEPLRRLRDAVLGHKVVQFEYHKPEAGAQQREVYPLRLVYLYGAWLLGAFDPAKRARRVFRLSRMDDVRVLDRSFEPDPDWARGPTDEEGRRAVEVRLLFKHALKRPLLERPSFYQTSQKEGSAGLEVTLQVRDIRDALPWVLSWGAGVQALEPPELREAVRQEARNVLLT